MSSTATSTLDSSSGLDNKKVRAEKPTEWSYPAGDVRQNNRGGRATARGHPSPQTSHAAGSGRERKKSSQSGIDRDGSSSRSQSRDKSNIWVCANPHCQNHNFIGSFNCVKCKLPRKVSNSIGPKLLKK